VVVQGGGGEAGILGYIANPGRGVSPGGKEADGGVAYTRAGIRGFATSLSF
jgi:hypothetical protein